MSLEIIEMLAPTVSTKTYGSGNEKLGVAFHETANVSVGADALSHAKLQAKGNVRDASWHYQVDDKRAYRSFAHEIRCWHAGDGRKVHGGNYAYVAIEVCVNADGDKVQAWRNAAELARSIIASGVGTDLQQHNHFSGKNCPTFLRSGQLGITWTDVVGWVRNPSGIVTPPPAPPAPPAPTPPAPPQEDDIMAKLPDLDWRSQKTSYDPMDERVQALLAADGNYSGKLDGLRGPISLAGLRSFQIEHNCGDGHGGADLLVGGKTWQSLLLGTKF